MGNGERNIESNFRTVFGCNYLTIRKSWKFTRNHRQLKSGKRELKLSINFSFKQPPKMVFPLLPQPMPAMSTLGHRLRLEKARKNFFAILWITPIIQNLPRVLPAKTFIMLLLLIN